MVSMHITGVFSDTALNNHITICSDVVLFAKKFMQVVIRL
jgi:hypothetical protein